MSYRSPSFDPGRIIKAVVIVIVCIIGLTLMGKVFENLDANHIMVVQSPVRGTLTWYILPGVKWQGFGRVTKYEKRTQFWFSAKKDQGSRDNESIKVRFNDGGHADISGSLAWEMPRDNSHMTALHTKYGSMEAITHQLVRPIVEKSVYMTGPLMSSQESYAARRNELLNYIEDQITRGVYLTETESIKQPDPMTGKEKTVQVVKIVERAPGVFARADVSPLEEFGIRTFNLSINEVKYEDKVERQIAVQQENAMALQTAIVEARKAEQAAITAEKNGQAEAAKSKWAQEVIKATKVTEAQQKLEVARLEAQAAAQNKLKMTLEGEGEATKRRLIMTADGGLEIKTKTWLEAQKIWAAAVQGYQGSWMPQIVMGGGASRAGGGATDLVELLTAQTAKQLALDMSMQGQANTRAPTGQ